VYLNEAIYYQNGFSVTLTPNNVATWQRVSQNRIAITHTGQFTKLRIDVAKK
jgi:hypothetical protein